MQIPKTKKCSKCKKNKALKYFYNLKRGKYGKAPSCKKCHWVEVNQSRIKHPITYRKIQKQFRNKRLKENRELINKYKNQPCADCAHSFPSYVMDFHHINSNKKYSTVSKMAFSGTWSIARIVKEIEKCIVLCANCHRIRTWGNAS